MTNTFIIKKLRSSLLYRLILPVALLTVTLIVLAQLPRENYFSPRPLNSKSLYENFYNHELPYVSVTVPNLAYTGLSYTVNGLTKGYYYYTINDGFCQFYLLDSSIGAPVPVRESLSLKGRLISLDSEDYRLLLSHMSWELDWTAASLEKRTSPYVVSTLPYPFYFNLLLQFLAYASVVLALSDMIHCLILFGKPLHSPAFRYLKGPDIIRGPLSQAELELKHSVLVQAGSLMLTPGFLISLEPGHELLLPRSRIYWIYSRSHMQRLPKLQAILPHTLYVMAEDGRTYRFTVKQKKELSRILELLDHADTGVKLGCTEENIKKAREWRRKQRKAK